MSAPATSTVNTSSTTIVSANSSRTGLIIKNVSTGNKTISLGLDGNTAVLNSGITLNSGDAFQISAYDYTSGAITAICSVTGGVLAIQEFP